MATTDRNEACREIEELLGSEGSRELADAILRTNRVGHWSGALEVARGMDGVEWGSVIDDAQALLDAETTYGTLTDYATGEAIRPATAMERKASLEAAELDGGVGAFKDDAGRTVYVAD